MNYPAWDVPIIGGAWVIGLISIFHIMISHFAIGGGLYLPMAEWRAMKTGRRDWLKFLPAHSKFFLILTGVYGALSGVGIWFAIGLAAPEASSTLIHNFVFAWATEWVFFLVELTSAAVYYYTWNRIPAKLHLKVGWVYAASSIFTLFFINGILTFMLTPSAGWLEVAGTGQEPNQFLAAFFNQTFWPSFAVRTLVCVSLAAVFALITGSLIDGYKHPRLKTTVVRWSVTWLLPSFLLMPIALLWYFAMVPETQRELVSLGVSTIGSGTFTQVTRTAMVAIMASATIMAVAYLFAYRSPRDFTIGYALVILMLALAATATSEQAREMIRKPFVVGEHMYSNGLRVSEIAKFNQEGYLANSMWASEDEKEAWAIADQNPKTIYASVEVGGDGEHDSVASGVIARGELMFRGQCASCHTLDGYRSMRGFLKGRDYQSIRNILTMLHENGEDSPYRSFMPPLVGTKPEVDALATYLQTLAAPAGHHDEEATVAKLP